MTKATQRYYWLKLQENFFERDEIRIIEAMPNGKDYILFYLKLMLRAINASGKLMFKDTIPYTPEMLSTVTHTNIDVVRVAVDTFIGLGLMEKLDDGALFIGEVNKMLGSETEYAQKKREYRAQKMSGQLEDKSKTKKDNVRQEIDIEKEIEKETLYNLPTGDDGGLIVDHCIQNNYHFNEDQLKAINLWFKYKAINDNPLTDQQKELTLKQLNQLLLDKYDIAYLIETSIARGYKGIMEPTCNSAKLTLVKNSRYPAKEYTIPETKLDKINLRNYLERCYLKKIDPRTGMPLTQEQKLVFKRHVQNSSKLRLSMTDYIFQHEVNTGICLLDQHI